MKNALNNIPTWIWVLAWLILIMAIYTLLKSTLGFEQDAWLVQ